MVGVERNTRNKGSLGPPGENLNHQGRVVSAQEITVVIVAMLANRTAATYAIRHRLHPNRPRYELRCAGRLRHLVEAAVVRVMRVMVRGVVTAVVMMVGMAVAAVVVIVLAPLPSSPPECKIIYRFVCVRVCVG